MGKASSSKKVARAAGTGGGRTARGRLPVLFYGAILAVVVLGVFGTAFSRHQREVKLNPTKNTTAPVANIDRWHVAYAVYVCDHFLAPFPNAPDKHGITTLGDGLINVHPTDDSAAGVHAVFGKFASAVKLKVTTTSMKLPAGADGKSAKTYQDGQKCGDKASVVKAFYDVPAAADRKADLGKSFPSGKQVAGSPANIKLTDGGALVLAFVPDDTKTVPYPPSLTNLDIPGDVAPGTADSSTTVASAPASTTAPGAPTTAASSIPVSSAPTTAPAPGSTAAPPATPPTTATK
jgi:hypothetical protein